MQVQIHFNTSDTLRVFMEKFKESAEHVPKEILGKVFAKAFEQFIFVKKNGVPNLDAVMWTDPLAFVVSQTNFFNVEIGKMLVFSVPKTLMGGTKL